MEKLPLTSDSAPSLGVHVEVYDLEDEAWQAAYEEWKSATPISVAADGGAPQPPTKVLFEPLTDEVLNIERFVRRTLDGWGLRPSDEDVTAIVESLERERAHQRKGKSRTVKRVGYDTTRSRPLEWAWAGRFLLGTLNLIVGQEGIGKSTLACWMMARLTRGELDGDLKGKPVNVAIVGDEDSFDHIWTPRLHAAGVDGDRVFQYEMADGGVPVLTDDKYDLARAVQEDEVKILYLDALMDNAGLGSIDEWKPGTVRKALRPARWLAMELDVAVIGSLHPNKKGATFRELMQGSVQFNAVARSNMLLASHPTDPMLRVLLRGKGNYAGDPDALAFTLDGEEIVLNDRPFSVSLASKFEPTDVTLDDVIESTTAKPKKQPSKAQRVREHLERVLGDGEEHECKPIYQELAALNIDEEKDAGTIFNARQKLGVKSRQHDGVWWWWISQA